MFDAVDGDSEVYHLVSVYMIDVLEHLDKKSQDIAAIAVWTIFLFIQCILFCVLYCMHCIPWLLFYA